MNIIRTNVFATPDETKELLAQFEQAQRTPVMALSTEHAFRGGFAGNAMHSVQRAVHKCALAHGLPEIEGFYGMDFENSEFVRV